MEHSCNHLTLLHALEQPRLFRDRCRSFCLFPWYAVLCQCPVPDVAVARNSGFVGSVVGTHYTPRSLLLFARGPLISFMLKCGVYYYSTVWYSAVQYTFMFCTAVHYDMYLSMQLRYSFRTSVSTSINQMSTSTGSCT